MIYGIGGWSVRGYDPFWAWQIFSTPDFRMIQKQDEVRRVFDCGGVVIDLDAILANDGPRYAVNGVEYDVEMTISPIVDTLSWWFDTHTQNWIFDIPLTIEF